MELISQNWLWIVIALGTVAFFYFRRGGIGHGGHSHGERDEARSPSPRVPEAAIDPVDGIPVRTAGAPTSVYQGRTYYFASKDSRDRFDASPQNYASEAAAQAMDRNTASRRSGRGRRGCC